jgi:site-specific DNA-methyltransferase (adenine-specific)
MIKGKTYTVHIGNNLDILPTLPDNSVDSIVTDPPYELGFMGKKWDSSGIAYSVELWRECLRVLKPGGHLLSFGGTRTWHRVAVGIEDAGFEVRDSIAWMYGSGFPKSLDVSKAIDKAAGAEREVVKTNKRHIGSQTWQAEDGGRWDPRDADEKGYKSFDITAPSTPEAKQWEGWGTALKPAFEPIVVARKPLIGTVAENVLMHGTGALNIDGSRIGTEQIEAGRSNRQAKAGYEGGWKETTDKSFSQGRWPANVILDEYTAAVLDEQSGQQKDGVATGRPNPSVGYGGGWGAMPDVRHGFGGSGGASRFYYVAKASKRDRNEGLEDLPQIRTGAMSATADGSMLTGSGNERTTTRQNFHPTVKPTQLMRYLVKLVTPPGGTVLDPFTGSGSTGKAAILEGFTFIGCELTEDYIPIIEGRLKHAEQMASDAKDREDEALF